MSSHPTGRALQLLSLLQTHRLWPASELAERFGVTERTIRRDVDRLRELGYRVDATTGPDGGYRLAVGSHLPPLVFDDDEAVAVVVGLRAAAGAAIAGIEDTSLQTLAKVEQALPDRLRRRVSALNHSVVSLQPSPRADRAVDPDALSSLASACRRHEEVRFRYRGRDRADGHRLVEPHQLLSAGHLWYLIAWDLRRSDWRTFRLDRLHDVQLAGRRFSPRSIPGGDAAAYLTSSVSALPRERVEPECIFCQIVTGESPSITIAESERAIAFMDIHPATPGHTLVIPRSHATDLLDTPADDLAACTDLAQRVAVRAVDRLGADGVNVLNCSGEAAWQTVFHLHLHVIPRFGDDPGKDRLEPPWQIVPGDLDEIARIGELLS